MLKNILKLNGVQGLSKNQQKEVQGGILNIHLFTCDDLTGFEFECCVNGYPRYCVDK